MLVIVSSAGDCAGRPDDCCVEDEFSSVGLVFLRLSRLGSSRSRRKKRNMWGKEGEQNEGLRRREKKETLGSMYNGSDDEEWRLNVR